MKTKSKLIRIRAKGHPTICIKIDAGTKIVRRVLPFKMKWLNALRSGEFFQGMGSLRCEGACEGAFHPSPSYCCLGVLSKIQGRLSEDGEDGAGTFSLGTLSESNPCYLALEITGNFDFASGFTNGLRVSLNGIKVNDLVDLNDKGASFEQIAKVIDLFWKKA